MAETDPESTLPDDDDALRRRLIKRVAIAGVLVVALVGGLAVFDALYVPPERKPPARIAALPPAPEPKAEEKIEEKPAEEPAAEQKAEAVAEKAESAPAAEPERTAAPSGTLPPLKPERPLTVPAHAQPAIMKPTEPLAVQKPEPARELVRGGPARPAPASRPIAQAVEAGRQYLIQLGMFNNVANAEELRAKLELAGVPSQIEARVQVGPFATRQEAEAAREKLRSLGMEPGLVMAVKR